MSGADWARAANILCVRLDNMGDVLMCTPAMRAIRQSAPGRRITLLASRSGAAVAPFVPEIDAVLTYAAPWMKNSAPHGAEEELAIARALKERAFDAAVIFTAYSQSPLPAALLCYLADIPLRLAHCRENPYRMLTGWIPEPEPEHGIRHEVRRQLDLAASIGCIPDSERMSFAVRDEDLAWMRRRLAAHRIGVERPWVLLHPGATAASRRYPAAHWSRVIAMLADELGVDVALAGDTGDARVIAAIIDAAGTALPATVKSLAGELDLGGLGAAIALAPVLVSNNSGPAHIAAAIGTPVVDLYALTNPQHTPWQVRNRVLFHDVPCRFCYKSICPQGHHDCLHKVEPAQVVAAVRSLLRESGADACLPAHHPCKIRY
ncbi:lipopolysaccharide heptosyltransferase II [Oxalobacteraceae bacterium CAVE-383]|nr:lipopolysaccharide heptosyltransferase II [Oxalobacteraceae bacterium CAVE-383]